MLINVKVEKGPPPDAGQVRRSGGGQNGGMQGGGIKEGKPVKNGLTINKVATERIAAHNSCE